MNDVAERPLAIALISDKAPVLLALGASMLARGYRPVSFQVSVASSATAGGVTRDFQNQLVTSMTSANPRLDVVIVDCHLSSRRSECAGVDVALCVAERLHVPVLVWSFLPAGRCNPQASQVRYGGVDCWVQAPFCVDGLGPLIRRATVESDPSLLPAERQENRCQERLRRLRQAAARLASFGHWAEKNRTREQVLADYEELVRVLRDNSAVLGAYASVMLELLWTELDVQFDQEQGRPAATAIKDAGCGAEKLIERLENASRKPASVIARETTGAIGLIEASLGSARRASSTELLESNALRSAVAKMNKRTEPNVLRLISNIVSMVITDAECEDRNAG